jgi:hypothetical protein
MTRIFFIIFFLGGLFSCSSKKTVDKKPDNTDTISSNDSIIEDTIKDLKIHVQVDRAYIGMTIDELKKEYSAAKFKNEPVFMYGVDGEEEGILVIENGKEQFFVWTMYGNDSITGIVILSPSIIIDKGIHVGMTCQDFLKQYPKETLAVSEMSEDYEFSYIEDLTYTVEFHTSDTNRVGKYTEAEDGYLYKGIQSPLSKIDRIHVR